MHVCLWMPCTHLHNVITNNKVLAVAFWSSTFNMCKYCMILTSYGLQLSVGPSQRLQLWILLVLIGIPELMVAAISSALTDVSYQNRHKHIFHTWVKYKWPKQTLSYNHSSAYICTFTQTSVHTHRRENMHVKAYPSFTHPVLMTQ